MTARTSRGAGRTALACLASVCLVAVFPAGPGRAGAPAAPGDDPDDVTVPPASIVILVDESGSLGDDGVRAEQEASAVIAQSELATDSQVSVVGFGGKTGLRGQTAVEVVCRPTTVRSATDREYLARCVSALRRRSIQEGPATDFAAAVTQGLSLLSTAPADHRKIIFLLTDGRLDVKADPAYGGTPEARDAAGRAQLNRQLATADQRGVQVWPLGFGSNPDQAALEDYARRGSKRTCGPGYPAPRARLVDGPAAVVDSLTEAFRSSQCLGGSVTPKKSLLPGETTSLTVDVPVIATDGAIAVLKRDPRVSITYLDPADQVVPKSGSLGDARFQVSGEGSPVEVLRIVNPPPGTWTVRLTSPPDLPEQTVAAQVLWQGAVRSSITLDPPTPRPGAVATVRITLVTRRDVIRDPAALRGLKIRAVLTGDGFTPVEVPVTADDQDVGSFVGQLTMPVAARGQFRAVGIVAGVGIATDQRPYDGRVSIVDPATQVTAQVRVDPALTPPGGELPGTLLATNGTGAAIRLRLTATGGDPGTVVSIEPPTVDLPASGDRQVGFRILVDPVSSDGPALVRVQVVDDKDTELRYAEREILLDIGTPVPFWKRWPFWLAVGAAVLLVLVILVLAYRRHRAARSVAGLTLTLLRDAEQRNHLSAPAGSGDRFRFVIRDEDTPHPRLDAAGAGDRPYVARRAGAQVDLEFPAGGGLRLRPGEPQSLPNGLELAVRDDRPPRRVRRAAPSGRGRPAPAAPESPGADDLDPTSVPSGTDAEWIDDDLL